MGIDELGFKSDELESPSRLITVMGWRSEYHSFAAKTYLSFIEEVSGDDLYFSRMSNKQIIELSEELRDWRIEDSKFGVKKSPLESDCTQRKGQSMYARGPLCQQEVDDLSYLLKFYGEQDAELIHYY